MDKTETLKKLGLYNFVFEDDTIPREFKENADLYLKTKKEMQDYIRNQHSKLIEESQMDEQEEKQKISFISSRQSIVQNNDELIKQIRMRKQKKKEVNQKRKETKEKIEEELEQQRLDLIDSIKQARKQQDMRYAIVQKMKQKQLQKQIEKRQQNEWQVQINQQNQQLQREECVQQELFKTQIKFQKSDKIREHKYMEHQERFNAEQIKFKNKREQIQKNENEDLFNKIEKQEMKMDLHESKLFYLLDQQQKRQEMQIMKREQKIKKINDLQQEDEERRQQRNQEIMEQHQREIMKSKIQYDKVFEKAITKKQMSQSHLDEVKLNKEQFERYKDLERNKCFAESFIQLKQSDENRLNLLNEMREKQIKQKVKSQVLFVENYKRMNQIKEHKNEQLLSKLKDDQDRLNKIMEEKEKAIKQEIDPNPEPVPIKKKMKYEFYTDRLKVEKKFKEYTTPKCERQPTDLSMFKITPKNLVKSNKNSFHKNSFSTSTLSRSMVSYDKMPFESKKKNNNKEIINLIQQILIQENLGDHVSASAPQTDRLIESRQEEITRFLIDLEQIDLINNVYHL